MQPSLPKSWVAQRNQIAHTQQRTIAVHLSKVLKSKQAYVEGLICSGRFFILLEVAFQKKKESK